MWPYREAWDAQVARRSAIQRGEAPEAVWMLEHPEVITTGRRSVVDLDEAALAAAGVEVFHTERGGLATWHGPGQLVGYLLVDLHRHGHGAKSFVCGLEAGVIAWLRAQGVPAARREGYPGVWVGHDKICALGIHIDRGVAIHGFALNLCPDLRGFSRITPCGITEGGVTSFERVAGRRISPDQGAMPVAAAVLTALKISFDSPQGAAY